MIQRFIAMIFKDVENENETKKVSVILRLNALIMCVYFLCLLGVFLAVGESTPLIMLLMCFSVYGLAFYTTYLNDTKLAVYFSVLFTTIWIFIFIRQFGWDCGIQHFIFVLVVLGFTISYRKLSWKLLMSAIACLFRLSLYAYTRQYEPRYVLGNEVSVIYQITNTIFVFIGITGILSVFTKDSMEMEQKLIQYNEKLHRLASVDPLTGLLNRRSMREFLEKKIRAYKDGHIEGMSIAIGDIDFFKKINDTYGHECGDMVLKRLSSLFLSNLENKGTISRWGGEEFLFAFHHMNGDEAMMVLNDLNRKMKKMEIHYKEHVIKVTMTFGLSEFDFERGIDYSVNDVDKKLYRGKEAGRDRTIY